MHLTSGLGALVQACERLPAMLDSLWTKVQDNPSPAVFLDRVTDEELRLYWAIVRAGQRARALDKQRVSAGYMPASEMVEG